MDTRDFLEKNFLQLEIAAYSYVKYTRSNFLTHNCGQSLLLVDQVPYVQTMSAARGR